MAVSVAADVAPLKEISVSGMTVSKISVGDQIVWTSTPPNDQVPYTVPFLVVGGPPPPPPPALALTGVASDSLSVVATGTPAEAGFGAVVGFFFYRNGTKANSPADADGMFTYTGLDDGTEYTLAFTFVNGSGTESAHYGSRTATTVATGHEVPSEISTAIDAIVATKMAPTIAKVNGAIIGVRTEDWDYFKAYGTDRVAALTIEDNFRYGSCTKLYTHMLVLKQIDAGHLSLNDTLDQFVSGVPNGTLITIKHLVMMQSGIPDFLQWDAVIQQEYFLHPTTPLGDATVMASIRSYAPQFQPGNPPAGYSPTGNGTYSNSNTYLLGKILESLDAEFGTSRDIRTIMYEDLLEPMGLNATEWPTGTLQSSPYSHGWSDNLALPTIQAMLGPLYFLAAVLGYPITAEVEFTAVDPSFCGPAGILGGTVHDLVKFGEALASREILSPEMRQLQDEIFVPYLDYTPFSPNEWSGPGHMMFGLGFIRWGDWILWIGNLGGYVTTVFVNPNTGTVVTAMQPHMQCDVIDLTYQICYLLDPDSTLENPAQTIRPQTLPAEGWVSGPDGIFVQHDPGDEDGNTQVPLKVPFYV